MKRLAFIITAAVLTTGLIAPAADAADSSRKKKRDTPGCVTKAEFRQIGRGATEAQVAAKFDTAGRQIGRFDNSYEAHIPGVYVEGYEETIWVPDYVGIDGVLIPAHPETHTEPGYWEEDEYVHVSAIDTVRSYKKCKSFQRGRGRVTINYDNYTSRSSGMRVYWKYANNPWRQGELGGKYVPKG